LSDIAVDKEGVNKVLKIFLEMLMQAERQEHNELTSDVINGYGPRKAISTNTLFELRVQTSKKYIDNVQVDALCYFFLRIIYLNSFKKILH